MEGKTELVIERVFDAPRALVWKAWTDPKLIQRWWGPRGVTNPTCEWEPRKGGKINIVMLAGKELGPAAGMRWPMKGVFTEVTPQKRLVFTTGAIDDAQDIMIESEVTVSLEETGEKTRMTVRILVTKVTKKGEMAVRGMEMGWNQQTDKLAEELGRMG